MKCRIIFFLLFPLLILAREWTVMVYMAADNGLAPWADSDLVEMQAVGSNDDIAVLAQVDKPNIGARRLMVFDNGSVELENLGIIDMCSGPTLTNFLVWGMENFPAQKYCVILWDHGTGWTAMPRRSFGSDWSSGNVLSIANGDFQSALSAAYDYTNKKIDLFSFDGCLMQEIEVAFELKDYAHVLVAYQTICPLAGFRYDQILQVLRTNPDIARVEWAEEIVSLTVENYVNVQPLVVSAIDLKMVNGLKESIKELCEALMINTRDQALIDLRNRVQTIPAASLDPNPSDDYVDLGDLIKGFDDIYARAETAQALDIYNQTIIQSAYWGEGFSKTTGLNVWFPDAYLEFKQLVPYYMNLDWTDGRWCQFLNWFYNQDDIRPSTVMLNATTVYANNDFHLFWTSAYDLAPVTYDLVEARDTILIFADACEDSSLWNLDGFSLTTNNVYSGNHAFSTGNTSNLQSSMTTKNAIVLQGLGLLSLYLFYNTEERVDSVIIEYGTFRDIHYGQSNGWQKRTAILPAGNERLKVSYHTNNTTNLGGGYCDEIRVYDLRESRYLRQGYVDTTIYLYNKLRGEYYYTAGAEDYYGNFGNLGDFVKLSLTEFAVPYSNPNPFQNSCDIVIDYPDSLQPTVEIFSITGRKVRKFMPTSIQNKTVHWDGKDEGNHVCGSGIYFILITDGTFRRIGKIARQR